MLTTRQIILSFINRLGEIHFPHITDITRQLWQWCQCRNLYAIACYIKSSDNKMADSESRRIHLDIEWKLADWSYQELVSTFGTPQTDLIVSRIK